MALGIMVFVLSCLVSFMLNVVKLNVPNKPFMLNVVMLNVVAPVKLPFLSAQAKSFLKRRKSLCKLEDGSYA